jgi:hypothetical protein
LQDYRVVDREESVMFSPLEKEALHLEGNPRFRIADGPDFKTLDALPVSVPKGGAVAGFVH